MSYKKVYTPGHPYAMSCGCVYEHRLIMEGIMGRYLLPTEQVHHKDENPKNNDPSNLVFCPSQKDHSQEHAYDPTYLIQLLIRYNDIYGKFPTRRQCDSHSQMPHSSTYIRRFGSWREAINLADREITSINEGYLYAHQ